MGSTSHNLADVMYAVRDWDDLPEGVDEQDVVDEVKLLVSEALSAYWRLRAQPLGLLAYEPGDAAPERPQWLQEVLASLAPKEPGTELVVDRFVVGMTPREADDPLYLRFNGKIKGAGPTLGYHVALPAHEAGCLVEFIESVMHPEGIQ